MAALVLHPVEGRVFHERTGSGVPPTERNRPCRMNYRDRQMRMKTPQYVRGIIRQGRDGEPAVERCGVQPDRGGCGYGGHPEELVNRLQPSQGQGGVLREVTASSPVSLHSATGLRELNSFWRYL